MFSPEVATWVQPVPVVLPIKMPFAVTVEMPVPPFAAASIPEIVDSERQMLLIARQPPERLRPFVNVDVAMPICANVPTDRPVVTVDVPDPWTASVPVVVAPPLMVSPPVCAPFPIVVDAVERIPPVKLNSVVVEFPTKG